MDIQKQQNRFITHWEKNSPLFGEKKWIPQPDFLFFVEIPLAPSLIGEMEKHQQNLQKWMPWAKGLWVSPPKMHITLALPGRQGLHFQGNDRSFMEKALNKIFVQHKGFEVLLGSINCFADGLFREVYDEEGSLYEIHKKICEAIPFSQNPAYEGSQFIPHISFYYGEGDERLFQHPEFERELPLTSMRVEKIFFGEIHYQKNEFQKKIRKEFLLG